MAIAFALLTLVGSLAVAAILVALHVLPTGLSPFRNPVSQYALTRFGSGYRAATIAAAIAGGAAAAFIGTVIIGTAATVTVVLLIVFAASRLAIGFFPMDAPDSSASRTGVAHNLLAIVAFGSITAAAFVAGGAFHDGGNPGLATLSTMTGIIMAVGTVGMLLTRRGAARSLFGAAERLIYIGFIVWFIAVGISGLSA